MTLETIAKLRELVKLIQSFSEDVANSGRWNSMKWETIQSKMSELGKE